MTDYVYAVLHDDVGNFLIARKYEDGYYFGRSPGHPERLVPMGQLLNGHGLDMLPGGGHHTTSESILGGARREFHEETGVHIPDGAVTNHLAHQHDGADRYSAGYFGVPTATLRAGSERIDTVHLRAGYAAQLAVMSHAIRHYHEIHQHFPDAPQDNELARVSVLDLRNPDVRAWIAWWDTGRVRNWHYHILRHLYTNILHFGPFHTVRGADALVGS
jgi:ADP-ribose pyrophosphatase YjhB (NUDIX family)